MLSARRHAGAVSVDFIAGRPVVGIGEGARSMLFKTANLLSALAVFMALGGCAFGPRALEKTHGPFAAAAVRVDEEQLLKSIVRLRYVESPLALDVNSIASQYELDLTAEARPFFSTEATGNLFRSFTSVLPFASISGANRPTISMTPADDASTIRQFLTPISMETLVFLAQSGWPVSSVVRIWVDRLNGIPNWMPPSGPPRNILPDFERFQAACELLQMAQDQELLSVQADDRHVELSGPVPKEAITAAALVDAAKNGFEYRPQADGKFWALTKKERGLVLVVNPAGRDHPVVRSLVETLNLKPNQDRYELSAATGVSDPLKNPTAPSSALRLAPRSSAQALFFLANGVEVPTEHLACGLVRQSDGPLSSAATDGVFRVHSCKGSKHRPPSCAYLAVRYRDYWFYIDDRDLESKATLLLMLQLRRLDFRRQQIGSVPALTLPVGR